MTHIKNRHLFVLSLDIKTQILFERIMPEGSQFHWHTVVKLRCPGQTGVYLPPIGFEESKNVRPVAFVVCVN